MSDLPPSSVPPIIESPLFHHPDGQRILFFIEAGGILHRPRLIRTLKKHDAVICTDPKHAQIILVDPDSWQGKEFIREWGNDQNKVVLSYTWVIKSIDATKPLLERDNWGDCKTYDDGLPISRPILNGDEETTVLKPKATPIKVADSSDGKRFTDSSTKCASVENSLLRESTTPIENGGSSSSIVHPSLYMSNPSRSSHTNLMPNHSPSASDPVPLFTQQQQAPLAMPFSMPGINMMSFPPQILTMFAQQPTTAQSPMSTQPSSMIPQVQENFTTALMDIMRMYGTLPGGPGTMSLSQRPMLPSMMARQMSQSAGSSGSASVILEDPPRASSNIRDNRSPSPLPLQELNSLRPSVKRKRKSDAVEDGYGHEVRETEDSNHEEDGDSSLAALEKKNKRVGERQSKSIKKNADTRRAQRTSRLPTPSRNQHQTSRPFNGDDSLQKLFVLVNGKPMQFFVQVDMNNRQEVTRAIKKHGGMITPRIPGADYVVLHPFSTSFKSLLSQAVDAQTHAVTHHFVLDSIDEGSIPDDMGDYTLNTKKTLQARQKSFRTAAKAKSKRFEKNTKRSEKHKEATDMKYDYVAWSEAPESGPSISLSSISSSSTSTVGKATQKPSSMQLKDEERHRPARIIKPKASSRTSSPVSTVKKPTVSMAQSSSGQTMVPKKMGKKSGYYPRDVTPPLSVKAQRFTTGYLYTQEERNWAERYLFILFKRDPDMALTAIAKVLHRKLPHHSVHSWSSFLLGSFRSEYEETRKKGGIAHRKEKSKWEAEQEKEEEVKVNSFQTVSKWKQEPDHMKEVKQENEELEKWHEHAEKVIEDQAMRDPSLPENIILEEPSRVSPMHIDDLDSKVVEEVKGASRVTQYTEEEADIQTIVHFFLSGGDDGESDESLIWAKLAEKKGHRTAEEWEKIFSQHDKEITSRYESCVTAREQAEA